MKNEYDQLKRTAEKVGKQLTYKESKELQETIKRVAKSGATPKDALGLTDAMVEGIYGQAYRLYNTGKYKEAIQLFRLLIMLNSTEPKFAMGLAASFHMMKDYKLAANTYTLVSIMDPQNPIPLYHTSDCMMKLGDALSASIALEMALKRAGEKPEYKTLRDRASLTLESLKKEIAKKNQSVGGTSLPTPPKT